MPHQTDGYGRDDGVHRLLARVSDAGMVEYAADFVATAQSLAETSPWVAFQIRERLALAGAGNSAASVAWATVEAFADTVRNRSIRGAARWFTLAHAFEAAVADDDTAACAGLDRDWREHAANMTEWRKDARERDRRAGLPFAN